MCFSLNLLNQKDNEWKSKKYSNYNDIFDEKYKNTVKYSSIYLKNKMETKNLLKLCKIFEILYHVMTYKLYSEK